MQMGFVFDMQTFGRESRDQLCRYDVLHSHRLSGLEEESHGKVLPENIYSGRSNS
jgi:hypothetical protein